MNVLNIDDCESVEINRLLSLEKDHPGCNHNMMRHTISGGFQSVGIHPRNLLNWRHLEKRSNELEVTSITLWEKFKMLCDDHVSRAKISHANMVLIFSDEINDDVMVIDPLRWSLHFEPKLTLIKNAIRFPDKTRSLTVDGEHGSLIRKTYKRSEIFRRRSDLYCRAFRKAICCRLKSTIEDGSNDVMYGNTSQHIFIITNENREYVLSVKNKYSYEWLHNSKFFTLK